MMQALRKNHPIWFCTCVILAIIPLFYIVSLQNPFAIGQTGYYIYTAIVESFFALCALMLARSSGTRIPCFRAETGSFWRGMFLGSFLLVYCIGSFFIGLQSYGAAGFVVPGVGSVLSLLLMMLSVGFFEEILCRGLLLHTLLATWGRKRSGLYGAVFLSSAIFGALHLINLLVRPTLVFFTLAQAIYTTMAGTFFAAVYLRSKNILPVILYHALHDVSTGVFYILISPDRLAAMNVHYAAGTDQSVSQGLFFIVAAIPLLIAALCLLRKVNATQHAARGAPL